jgi:hypothetical protein
LRDTTGGGNWMTAAGHYHSQTPELAETYRQQVVAAMAGGSPSKRRRFGCLRPRSPLPRHSGLSSWPGRLAVVYGRSLVGSCRPRRAPSGAGSTPIAPCRSRWQWSFARSRSRRLDKRPPVSGGARSAQSQSPTCRIVPRSSVLGPGGGFSQNANRLSPRSQRHDRMVAILARSKRRGPMRAYMTAGGIALGLVAVWAALVPIVA